METKDEKARRMALALRENLRRRKQQARDTPAKADDPPENPAAGPDSDD